MYAQGLCLALPRVRPSHFSVDHILILGVFQSEEYLEQSNFQLFFNCDLEFPLRTFTKQFLTNKTFEPRKKTIHVYWGFRSTRKLLGAFLATIQEWVKAEINFLKWKAHPWHFHRKHFPNSSCPLPISDLRF